MHPKLKVLFLSILFLSSFIAAAGEKSVPFVNPEWLENVKWAERIKISALFMGEAIASSYNEGKNTRFSEKKSYSTFCFPRASLYLDADLDKWAKAHFAFKMVGSCGFGSKNDENSFLKFKDAEESYIDIGNLEFLPYYSRIGIQFVDYGSYERNVVPITLTQAMTQTQAAAITVGYQNLDNGLQASVYSFSGKKKRNGATKIVNGGIHLGYDSEQLKIALDWMSNIAGGVNYIVHQGSSSQKNPLNEFGYRKRVAGVSTSVQAFYKKLDVTIQYTTALSNFHLDDLSFNNKAAKPAAWLVDAGCSFPLIKDHNSRLGASYQQSRQAVNIRGLGYKRGLPKSRTQLDYTVDLWQDAQVGAHMVWDRDYKIAQGGTGAKSWTFLGTLKVKI